MFKESIADLITTIQTITDFKAGAVLRGDQGKATSLLNPGCLIMPDFDSIKEFSGDPGDLQKTVPFLASAFIAVAGNVSLEKAEDAAFDLLEKVLNKVQDTEFEVSMNGSVKLYRWEPYGKIDFMERSAKLVVINVEFKMNMQL
jgi:hypothetical protein